MESYWEMETTEDVEDNIFHAEAQHLRTVLNFRQHWHWLPWVHAVPSVKEKIFFERGSVLLTPQRCWRVSDENLYLAEHGAILYRDHNDKLICPLSFREHDHRIVWLTDQMRKMRKSLTGK